MLNDLIDDDGIAQEATERPAAKRSKKGERPPMVFDRRPITAEARAWVAHLVEMIEAREEELGTRQRKRRQTAQRDLVELVGRFAGELAASVDRDALPLLPCHKNANRLSELGISHRLFEPVFEGLVGLSLITIVEHGSHRRWDAIEPDASNSLTFTFPAGAQLGRSRGWVTRIRPTEALHSLIRGHGIERNSAQRHFPRLRPPPPVQLRGSSAWAYGEKHPGRLMKVPKRSTDSKLDQLKAEVEELNAFIRQAKIEGVEGIELTGWTRIFNQGDQPGFAWDRGGRLYARPGDATYQSLPQTERGRLQINGEAVVEIDIRASHLSLVYALKGQSLASHVRVFNERGYFKEVDPYLVGDLPRAVVKAWVTITLGAGRPPRRWPRDAVATMREDQGLDLRTYRTGEVGRAILERHPILQDLTGISWAKLQFIESQAIIGTMLQLMRDYAIPALPVHDSLIVPRSAWWFASWVLRDKLTNITGHEPMVLKLSPSITELPAPHKTPYPYEFPQRSDNDASHF